MTAPAHCEYDLYGRKLKFPTSLHARRYLENVAKQKSRTNSKAPNFMTDTYLRTGSIKLDYERFKEMMLQNRALVQKLNTIERNTLRSVKAIIDNSLPYSNASWREDYKRYFRFQKMKAVIKENIRLAVVINSIKRSPLIKVPKLTDATGPHFFVDIYFKPTKAKQDYERFKELMEGNVALLQIINNIQRSTIRKVVTRTDAKTPNCKADAYLKSGFLRKDYARFETINKENFNLLLQVNNDINRYTIHKVVTRTDAQTPNCKADAYFKSTCLRTDYARFKAINKENFNLLLVIVEINRHTGRTENYNPHAGDYADRRSGPYIKQVQKVEKENHQLYTNIMKATGRLPSHKVLLKQWRENQHKIQFKARMPIALPYIADHSRIKTIVKTKRPIVFLDLENSNGTSIGRLKIVLYYDIAPKASMNFIELCVKSKKDIGRNKPNLSGTGFHRIFTDLYAEGGDMIYRNGCGGKSAEGRDFPPENFLVNHNCRGTLSMRPTEAGYVNSIFTLSFRPLPSLNGKRIAFGRVIQGLKNLKVLESFASKNGKPKQNIVIKNCGILYNMPQHNSTSP